MTDATTLGFSVFGMIAVGIIGLALLYLVVTNWKNIFPSIKFAFEYPFSFIYNLFENNSPMIASENCSLYPSSLPVSRVPSIYVAHIAFFFGFLFTNAYIIYNLTSQQNADQTKIDNRKSRSLMTMIVLAIVYFAIVIIRYNVTGCESLLGIIFTTVIFGSLGVGIYKLAEYCGARNADILGIASSIYDTNVNGSGTVPVVCSATH